MSQVTFDPAPPSLSQTPERRPFSLIDKLVSSGTVASETGARQFLYSAAVLLLVGGGLLIYFSREVPLSPEEARSLRPEELTLPGDMLP